MIFLLALVALLAFAAGGLGGWIAGSEYHWRFDERAQWPRRTDVDIDPRGNDAFGWARRDEWPGS